MGWFALKSLGFHRKGGPPQLPGGTTVAGSLTATGTISADKFRASATKTNADVAFGYTGADNTGHYLTAGKLVSVVSGGHVIEAQAAAVEITAGIRLVVRNRIDDNGGLAVSGTGGVKTGNYTVAIATDFFLEFDPTAGAITVALPAVATAPNCMFAIRKTVASANAVTIDPNGAELINGAATLVVANNTTAWIQADSAGTAWRVVGITN